MLVSSIFGFRLGIGELKEASYFFYNISEEESKKAFFIRTTT